MATKPIATTLPADLPENWQVFQTITPNGTETGLTRQHGYNYQSEQINKAQSSVNAINNAFPGLQAISEKDQPNGYAGLDADGKLRGESLPEMKAMTAENVTLAAVPGMAAENVQTGIEELFVFASDIKSAFAGITGEPATADMMTEQIRTIAQDAKDMGAALLTASFVPADGQESLTSLFSKIGSVVRISHNLGDGSDGDFNSTENVVWDTSTYAYKPYIKQFNTFTLNMNHSITLSHPVPVVVIMCKGPMVVNGAIDLTGMGQYLNIDVAGIQASMPAFIQMAEALRYPVPIPGNGGNGGAGGNGGNGYQANYNSSWSTVLNGYPGHAGGTGLGGFNSAQIGNSGADQNGYGGLSGGGGNGGEGGSGSSGIAPTVRGGYGAGINGVNGILTSDTRAAGGNLLVSARSISIGYGGRIITKGLNGSDNATAGKHGGHYTSGDLDAGYYVDSGGSGGGGGHGGHGGGGITLYHVVGYTSEGILDTSGGLGSLGGAFGTSTYQKPGTTGYTGAAGAAGIINIIQLQEDTQ